MIRPFYSSRLFWLGVPGLVFLLWGWWDSTTNSTAIHYFSWRNAMIGAHWQGGITVGLAHLQTKDERARFNLGSSSFGVDRVPLPMSPGWSFYRFDPTIPPYGTFESTTKVRLSFAAETLPTGSSWWSFFIPHWTLLLVYSSCWLLAAGGWQRRKARLLKLHAASHE